MYYEVKYLVVFLFVCTLGDTFFHFSVGLQLSSHSLGRSYNLFERKIPAMYCVVLMIG